MRFHPQPSRLTRIGRRPQGVADVPLTKIGTAARDKGKRVNSAGVVRKDGTGANRMTGLVTRDSAQRRLIASIGRMRVLTYTTQFDRLPPLTLMPLLTSARVTA